jgi:hypothetical protein
MSMVGLRSEQMRDFSAPSRRHAQINLNTLMEVPCGLTQGSGGAEGAQKAMTKFDSSVIAREGLNSTQPKILAHKASDSPDKKLARGSSSSK